MANKLVKVQKEAAITVIGAGPVGAFTVLNLAKFGLASKTVVFEEHSCIGRPSHCAGHLNIETLKKLNVRLSSKIIENKIRGAKFYSPSGLNFRVERKTPITLVVNRELFDWTIAKEAEKMGAEFRLKFRVKKILVENRKVNGLIVQNLNKKLSERIYSRLIVDAEGCPATLLKKANFSSPIPQNFVYGGQAEVDKTEDVENDIVEVYLGKRFAEGLFAWIIPRKDGTAKVGLAVKRGNPKKALLNFIHKHPIASKKLRKSQILSLSFHPIPLGGPITKTFGNGLLVVGDAASQVKPTTGGGVLMGMICARLAAKTALKAYELNDFSERTLAEYEKAWKREIGFELKAMLKVRRMFNKLSDKQLDKLFELCIKAGLNQILEKVGDLDLQGRTLLKVASNPKGFIPLLYLVWSALTRR